MRIIVRVNKGGLAGGPFYAAIDLDRGTAEELLKVMGMVKRLREELPMATVRFPSNACIFFGEGEDAGLDERIAKAFGTLVLPEDEEFNPGDEEFSDLDEASVSLTDVYWDAYVKHTGCRISTRSVSMELVEQAAREPEEEQ